MAARSYQMSSIRNPAIFADDSAGGEKEQGRSRHSSFGTEATEPASSTSFHQSSLTSPAASLNRSSLVSLGSGSLRKSESKGKKKSVTIKGKKVKLDEYGNPIKKRRKPVNEAEEPTTALSMTVPKRPNNQELLQTLPGSDDQSVTLSQAGDAPPPQNERSDSQFSNEGRMHYSMDHSSVVSDITTEIYEEAMLMRKSSFVKRISFPSIAPIAEGMFENSRSSDPSNWAFTNNNGRRSSGQSDLKKPPAPAPFPGDNYPTSKKSPTQPFTINGGPTRRAVDQTPHFQKMPPSAMVIPPDDSANLKKPYPSASQMSSSRVDVSRLLSTQPYTLNEETMQQASVQSHRLHTTMDVNYAPTVPIQSVPGLHRDARFVKPAPQKYPSLPSRTESLNSWQTYESDRKPGRGPDVIPRAPVQGKWDELNPVQESTSFSSSKSSSHVGHRDQTTSSTSNATSNAGHAKWEDIHGFSDYDEHVGQDKWEDINGFDSDYGSDVGQAKWEDINDFDTNYGEDVGQDKWEDMNGVYNDYGEDVGHGKWEDINDVYNDYGEDVGHHKWEDMNDVHNDYDEDVGQDKWEDMNGFGIYNCQKHSGQAKWEDINGLENSKSFIDDSRVACQRGGSKKTNFTPESQSTHAHDDARARNHPRSSNSNGRGQNASAVGTAMAANNSDVGEKPSTTLALDLEYHELLIMYLRTMGTDMDVAEDIALRFAATQQATKDTGEDKSNASMIPENMLQQIQTTMLDDNRTSRRTPRSSAPPYSIVPEPPRGQTQRRPGRSGRGGGPGRNSAAQNRAAGRTWTRARAPGAIQMDGRAFGAPRRPISNIGFDDESPPARSDDMAVNMTAPVEGHIVEATAVKDDASMPVVYAESSPLSMKHLWQERSLRRSFILVMVVVGIIVTVVVLGVSKGKRKSDVSFGGSTASPSSSPTFILEDLLLAVSLVSGDEAVSTPGTPQRNAVGWLSSVDEFLQERSGPALLQRYAMATFYYATQGNKWLIQEKWLDPTLHECDWSTTSNIKCATDSSGTRTIVGIDLTRAGLIGSIPKEIGQFQSLEYLRISNNRITGSLPSELLNLRKMNVLDVNSNALSGSLPGINAKDLAYLDLSFNTITGEIPVSMFQLSGLRILDLSYNHISGTVPRSIADIKVLSKLNLRSNHLHSTLPADFEDLLTIDFLNLDSNLITGTLPYWVTGLVSRQELTLGNNLLSGSIPDINIAEFSFASEMSIKLIDLSRNGLNGTVPMWAGLITSLKKLDISRNQFSGTLTVEIGMWKSIEVFSAANNRLTGVLPPYIPPALNYLDLSDNQFSGPLSVGLCNYTNLKFVSLAGNLLGGAVAPLLECMTLIKTLQLSRCALTGTIPPGMKNIVGLETFYAENNFLNGTIPSELGTLSFLQTFRISNNSFVGTLPTEFGRLVEMTSLHVDGNELQGTIPEELVLLTDLESLKVNDNYFEPTFPSAICTIVGEISVSDVGCEFNCPCCTNRTLYCGDDVATGEAPGWNNVFVTPKGGEGRE